MRTFILTGITLMGLGAAAWSQESFSGAALSLRDKTAEESETERLPLIGRDPAALPRSISEPEPAEGEPSASGFSLGVSTGYLSVKDADHGTWFVGIQGRLRLGIFAAEASVQFHQNKYEDGDITVTQYPVQLTAFLYFLSVGPVRPYILGGVGWYHTLTTYSGPFSAIDDHDQNVFGEHLGAGAEFFLGTRISLDVDVRYIFLNATSEQVINRDFNYWQITGGLNFFF